LPGWVRRGILGPLASAWPKADWLPRVLRAKTVLMNLAREPAAAYANTLSLCRLPLRRHLLREDVRRELAGYAPEEAIWRAYAAAPGDPLGAMLAADTATLLPDMFLTKVDRASMAFGLEVRPPLVDHELLELAARIPSGLKIHRGQTKWILKQAVRDKLPAELLRRPKQGFEIPIDAWLRGPLRAPFEAAVLSPASRISELLDQRGIERLFAAHQARLGRHGQILWALLVFATWLEEYLGSAVQVSSSHARGAESHPHSVEIAKVAL
jgi:asparagine synthase (glutamine-hydrolysing)